MQSSTQKLANWKILGLYDLDVFWFKELISIHKQTGYRNE